MSEASQKLLTSLTKHLANVAMQNTAMFGDRSDIARLLTLPAGQFSADDAISAVETMLTAKAYEIVEISKQAAVRATLEGELALLRAVPLCQKKDSAAAPLVRQAIEHFDTAFGLVAKRQRNNSSSGHQTKLHPVDHTFARLESLECTDRAWFLAYDLLCDWVPATAEGGAVTSQPKSRREMRSASISILGAVASGLRRLEVELFPSSQGTFDPDPRWLGLTAIRWDTDPGQCLLRSMDRIWQLSQLSAHWRGRWRIVHPPEGERPANSAINYAESLHGHSAEAATLCALLAATRDPYLLGMEPLRETPIDIKMALSATVRDAPTHSPRPVLDARLGPVTGINGKMAAAYPVIDSVVFAAKEVLSPSDQSPEAYVREIQELQQKETQALQANSVYTNLRIVHAKTIVDALDLVLLTNRHLHAYHQEQRRGWLKQWIGGTGISQEFDPDQSVPPKEGDAPLPSGSAR